MHSGSLLHMEALLGAFDEAVRTKHLVFYPSRIKVVDSAFHIRYCPAILEKERSVSSPENKTNPFLPLDRNLFIADIAPSHALVFNKFSLVRPHLLLVTREYAEQDASLTVADFEAVRQVFESVGDNFVMFYNCGPCSGASQKHRHFQFVPSWPDCAPRFGAVRHCTLSDLSSAFAAMVGSVRTESFNLLFSPSWGMCIVPRHKEYCSLGISLNALAFAGCILVKRHDDLERISQENVRDLLGEVTTKATP